MYTLNIMYILYIFVHKVRIVHNVHIVHKVHIHKNTLKESEFVLRNFRFTTQCVSEINKNFKRKGFSIL